jgi:hypothetical protein
MRSLKIKELHAVYWVATLLFVMPQGWAAVQYLIGAPRMVQTINQLGYPEYFMQFLGVAKLLGIAAIVTSLSPTLKEWAYAGFTFDAVGAFTSHLGAGDSLAVALVPLGFGVMQLVSYFTWRTLRERVTSRVRKPAHRFRTREMAESVV